MSTPAVLQRREWGRETWSVVLMVGTRVIWLTRYHHHHNHHHYYYCYYQEAQTILNSVTDKLILKLHNKRGEEQKKKKMENKNILTSDLTSPILAVSIDQARLPLPCSPEYILLRKSREKKRSGSLSSLPDCSQLTGSMSVSSEEDTTSSSSASASTSESSSRSERQTAWLRSLKQTKTSEFTVQQRLVLLELWFTSIRKHTQTLSVKN